MMRLARSGEWARKSGKMVGTFAVDRRRGRNSGRTGRLGGSVGRSSQVGPNLPARPDKRGTAILEGQGRSCDARLAVLFEKIVDNLDGERPAVVANLCGRNRCGP